MCVVQLEDDGGYGVGAQCRRAKVGLASCGVGVFTGDVRRSEVCVRSMTARARARVECRAAGRAVEGGWCVGDWRMAAVVGDAELVGRRTAGMLFGGKARLAAAMTCLLARGRGLRQGREGLCGLAGVRVQW